MASDESIVRLLNVLYSAPTDPQRWSDFLRHLGAVCGVEKATLLVHDFPREGHQVLAGLGEATDDSAVQRYESHYWRFDEWTQRLCKTISTGQVWQGEDVWPSSELHKSVYYNEFLRGLDIFRLAAIFHVVAPGVFEGVGLYRGLREDDFEAEELSVLRVVAPHLRTALETRRRLLALETRVTDLEIALNSLGTALLLVSTEGRIVFLNDQAQAILEQTACLFVHKGSLIAKSPRDTTKLRELIERAIATATKTSPDGGGAISIARAGKRPLHVLISPIPPSDIPMPANAAAVIFLDDPELQTLTPEEVLRALFGLTRAESKLARSVLDGHSLSEAAELCGVSRETVKSQMNAVFSKTGTRRQGELIRLLSRLPDQHSGVQSFRLHLSRSLSRRS